MNQPLLRHLQALLSQTMHKTVELTGFRAMPGGDSNAVFVLYTKNENWLIKISRSVHADLPEKEHNGLLFLQHKSPLKIPEPIVFGSFADTRFLVTEYLQRDNYTLPAWQALGEGLAALHRQTQAQCGFAEDNYIGSLPQCNKLTDLWTDFYAAQRILPLFQKALAKNECTLNDVKQAEKICRKLPNVFPAEPPALLHGDLWHGNVMACANAEVAVFDPAVYYGHRETDIAMTLLFSGFDEHFYRRYHEVYPLQKGWQSRVLLFQLYPLLVHLILFGSIYYSRVKNVLAKYS